MNPAALGVRVVAVALLLGACSTGGGAPIVADAYMPQPGEGAPGAFYLTITGGGSDDSIVGAASSACEQSVLHESIQGDDGMMTMQPVEGGIPIPAGEEVVFEPGGLHVMCLQPDVEVGATVPLAITFAEAGDVETEATVQER